MSSFNEVLHHQWAPALSQAPLRQLSLPDHLEDRAILRYQPC